MKKDNITNRKKHINISIILVCLLLLSAVFPTAGCSSGISEPETTNGMYDEYILTEEDLAELNEAYFKRRLSTDPEHSNLDEEQLETFRESIYGKFAESIEEAMMQTLEPGTFYFGKFSDCIIVGINGMVANRHYYKINGYEFKFYSTVILVCYDAVFYELNTAYENGLLSQKDIQVLYQMCDLYYFNRGDLNEKDN